MIYLKLLSSSFQFATNALRMNKLRTLLSLLGVTVGIFSIIAVLAAVDSMDKMIKSELSGFDKNMIYIFNGSFGPTDVPAWKVAQFPRVTYEEYDYLKKNLHNIEYISFNYFAGTENIRVGSNTAAGVFMKPTGSDAQFLDNIKLSNGRFYNESEAMNGNSVVVIGSVVAETLFGAADPVGEQVRLYGKRFTVIGVMDKQGSISIGGGLDEAAYVPINAFRSIFGDNSKNFFPVIVLKPVKDIEMKQFEAEIESKLRNFRGLKVGDDNNFFVNVFGGMLEFVDNLIAQVNVIGWIISMFSLLVGGFGIANIMFVSVKERTYLIGVQKAIGAKRNIILFQFLFEAIILALIGGFVGIALVWGIGKVITLVFDFNFILSFSNILLGLSLSTFIGLISGYLPARSAARLDPVEAIRSGI